VLVAVMSQENSSMDKNPYQAPHRIIILAIRLLGYGAFLGILLNGLASVLLAWALYDSGNRPLTICLNVYLFVSLFSVLLLAGTILLWEREGRMYRTSHPNPRGPLHN
jgi:hypothetical protein